MLEEKDLVRILQDEEQDASAYYDSELAEVQAEAMRRYHAQPYGTEREGRSSIVTHDVEDTINWMLPDLMRTFLSSDDIISVEDDASDSEDVTNQVADYLSHIFWKDNDGVAILHDFCFDALLQRIGIVRIGWEDPKPKPPKEYRGLDELTVAAMEQDPLFEIIEQEQDENGLFNLLVKKTPRSGKVKIDVIPPEEFAFARRSADGATCDYKRWKREMFISDIVAMFPDKKDQIRDAATGSVISKSDEEDDVADARRYERFPDEDATGRSNADDHISRRKGWLIHEELLIDFDEDDITERRSVYRLGNLILENEEIDRSMYVDWSPIRVAHRMAGRSIVDTLVDIQKIRTEITRLTLDGLAQSLVQRTAADISKLGDGGYDALLDADIGGVIPTKGNPRDVVMPLMTPDVSASAYPMLEYWDQRSELASGVSRHAQGIQPEAITDTRGGIAMLQSAAKGRIELVARWLGKALERVFENALHLIVAHQDQPRIIKINGKPIEMDPRLWSDEMTVSMHVGMAGEDRQTKIQNLSAIREIQEGIMTTAGVSNPIVGIPQYRETLSLMASAMGFKDPDRFFLPIPDDYQPPQAEEQQDPKLIEAQAKIQLEEQKAQSQMQIEQQKMQVSQQLEAAKLQSEAQIAQMRIQAEQEIARERMAAEMELARWKAEREYEIAGFKAVTGASAKADGGSANGGVRMGGKIG